MGSIDVIHTEVVNYQCEGELIVTMLAKLVSELYGRIAVAVTVIYKSLVGKEAGLWEAIHELPEIDGGFAIVCDGTQVVIGDDLSGM